MYTKPKLARATTSCDVTIRYFLLAQQRVYWNIVCNKKNRYLRTNNRIGLVQDLLKFRARFQIGRLQLFFFINFVLKINYKLFSNEHIHLAHIEPLKTPPQLITLQHFAEFFWCWLDQLGPLAEKQQLNATKLGTLAECLWVQCVPNGCLIQKITYN